jgi:hypothetical protein
MFWNVPQCRKRPVDDFVDEAVIPIGSLDTPKGRLFVFPNSQIHKLTPMTSTGGSARRRIVVFWLVNPDEPTISTGHVAGPRVSHEEALKQPET